MGPITDWSAINVTVVSYRRYLAFGLVSCPDVVPDIDELRDDFDAEIDSAALLIADADYRPTGTNTSSRSSPSGRERRRRRLLGASRRSPLVVGALWRPDEPDRARPQ